MFSVYFDPGNLLRHQLVVIIMDLINMGDFFPIYDIHHDFFPSRWLVKIIIYFCMAIKKPRNYYLNGKINECTFEIQHTDQKQTFS